MTRTRQNYTVCLPKRRIYLEYESTAAQRQSGSLDPNHFDDRHFIRCNASRPSVSDPAGLYFTCTLDIDSWFAARRNR